MFQYAAGLQLAHIRQTQLGLDISEYESNNKLRNYRLNVFDIKHNNFTLETFTHHAWRNSSVLRKLWVKILQRPQHINPLVYHEKHYNYDEKVLNLPDNVYLAGYWQCERYFSKIEELIRKTFTIKVPLDGKNKLLAKQIREVEAVSIHVRRGDYVTNPAHPLCSTTYYNLALKKISTLLTNPHFFVFSDDMAWTQANIKSAFPTTYVGHNGSETDYEDLRLMSFCKHHIIANSSFSWWGAWLSTNSAKVVIAPNTWFGGSLSGWDTRDLLPSSWIRI
jgi:hypothetical protein